MKREYLREHGKSGVEIIEEAFHLLRTAPLWAMVTYFLGSVPFLTALLFFWAEMSRSPYAEHHLGSASFGLVLLFVWMKFCHVLFARQLRNQISGEIMPTRARANLNSLLLQTTLQVTGLFVLPVAAIITLPFGWVYAFYQSVTALDDGKQDLGSLASAARQQAALWSAQNHFMLLLLFGFTFYVFLNLASLILVIPQLLRMLFGIESIFSQSPVALLNTTCLSALCALTYLCVDPLIKACYALRCFYGSSLRTGFDLTIELRLAAPLRILVAAVCLGLPYAMAAESSSQVVRPTAISTSSFDSAIRDVIQQPKYTWRMPREKLVKASEKNWFTRTLDQALKFVTKIFRVCRDAIKSLFEWLFPSRQKQDEAEPGDGWMISNQAVLFLLLIGTACVLAIILLRTLTIRKSPSAAVESVTLTAPPDLTDQDIAADLLPEDSWTKLGRELLEKGELRLALRAFYLASLSHLAGSGLVSIARFKSNRDYERELRRRGHSIPGLLPAFSENIGIMDSVWYGRHEPSLSTVELFQANAEQIKTRT